MHIPVANCAAWRNTLLNVCREGDYFGTCIGTWMWQNADFGPADSDVREEMKNSFIEETRTLPPKGWNCCSDCGKDLEDECEC